MEDTRCPFGKCIHITSILNTSKTFSNDLSYSALSEHGFSLRKPSILLRSRWRRTHTLFAARRESCIPCLWLKFSPRNCNHCREGTEFSECFLWSIRKQSMGPHTPFLVGCSLPPIGVPVAVVNTSQTGWYYGDVEPHIECDPAIAVYIEIWTWLFALSNRKCITSTYELNFFFTVKSNDALKVFHRKYFHMIR